MAVFISYCPRCDSGFTGDTKALANDAVRAHLVRAQGADMDEGLHDFALEQWDDPKGEKR